jgi:plasmid stabilization system protein ParE
VTGRRLSLIVWAQAAREIEEASAWWHANRHASPDALSDDVARAFALITLQPGIGAPALGGRLRNVRRLTLRRVGYFLYYRVVPEREEVQVLRFRHAHRRPGPALGA